MSSNGSRFEWVAGWKTIGVAEIGLDGKIKRASRTFAQILGYDVINLVGMSIEELIPKEDRHLAKRRIDALQNGEVEETIANHRYVTASGEETWCSIEKKIINEKGEDAVIHALVFPLDKNAHRVERLEQTLQEVLKIAGDLRGQTGGTTVNVNSDNDHIGGDQITSGGQKNNTTNNQAWLIAVVVLAMAAVVLGVAGVGIQSGWFSTHPTPSTPTPP
jgi:PAS domain S-box-containing protein